MTEIIQYYQDPEGEHIETGGNRQESFGTRLAGAAIGLVHAALFRLEGDSWTERNYFEGRVEEETAFGPASLDIFLGDISTADGLVVNAILRRALPGSGIRHRIFATGPDNDGIAGTHIGTLKGARKKAQRILLARAGLIEGTVTDVRDVEPEAQGRLLPAGDG